MESLLENFAISCFTVKFVSLDEKIPFYISFFSILS